MRLSRAFLFLSLSCLSFLSCQSVESSSENKKSSEGLILINKDDIIDSLHDEKGAQFCLTEDVFLYATVFLHQWANALIPSLEKSSFFKKPPRMDLVKLLSSNGGRNLVGIPYASLLRGLRSLKARGSAQKPSIFQFSALPPFFMATKNVMSFTQKILVHCDSKTMRQLEKIKKWSDQFLSWAKLAANINRFYPEGEEEISPDDPYFDAESLLTAANSLDRSLQFVLTHKGEKGGKFRIDSFLPLFRTGFLYRVDKSSWEPSFIRSPGRFSKVFMCFLSIISPPCFFKKKAEKGDRFYVSFFAW